MRAVASPARVGDPVWTLLVLALVAGLAAMRHRPPAPAPADAPTTEFSATRAQAVLTRLVGDEAPHGVGTEANAAVRERIAAELTDLGLTVERQAAISCRGITCAPVLNLIAEIPGAHEAGPAVLLASHYDSVHAGPGVADDLHGVAVGLETARALLAGPPLAHPVRLLIDEGEEVGLLGAAAFVEQHPRAHEIAVVVNAEARGSSGPSSLFETSDGNAALVEAYVSAAPRPHATSLAYEVYRRMPNDTDLTVFKQAGVAGLNFAFVGDVGHYHTPLDDLAHLHLPSVQHQGDHVLAAARALAQGPLPLPAQANLIYADVLGLGVVRWPEAWAVAVAVALLVLLAGLAGVAARRGRARPSRIGLGAVAVIGTVTLAVAAALGLAWLVGAATGEPVPAFAWPTPMRLSLWLATVTVALVVAAGLRRWAAPLELALGVWITWSLGAVALAVVVPGASVALCLPLMLAVVGLGWAVHAEPAHEIRGIVLAGVVLVAMWTTLSLALEDVFGLGLPAVVAAPVAVAITGMLPALGPAARPRGPSLPRLAAGATVVATIVAALVPLHDDDHPRRIALHHYDDRATGQATVAALAIDGLPDAVRDAGELAAEPTAVLPWTPRPMHTGPAVPAPAPAPRLDPVDGGLHGRPDGGAMGGVRRVRARLRSPRRADRAVVLLPSEQVAGAFLEGRPLDTGSDRLGRVLVFGLPPHGVVLDLELRTPDPVEATVVDCVSGLPDSARDLVQARDAAGAVTIQWGDVGCIATRATL